MAGRRAFLLGGAALLGGCFEGSIYERNEQQRKFLDGLAKIAKPALASGNPLAVEEAVRQSLKLADSVGPFANWTGTITRIEGNAQNVAVTIEVGPQVSLYAFNDWTLAMAGAFAQLFSTRSRETPPPGLSDPAVAALKAFRLGERVKLAGRLGEIAGSGLFDLSNLFGKSEADNRQFLQTPRFVARIEVFTASK